MPSQSSQQNNSQTTGGKSKNTGVIIVIVLLIIFIIAVGGYYFYSQRQAPKPKPTPVAITTTTPEPEKRPFVGAPEPAPTPTPSPIASSTPTPVDPYQGWKTYTYRAPSGGGFTIKYPAGYTVGQERTKDETYFTIVPTAIQNRPVLSSVMKIYYESTGEVRFANGEAGTDWEYFNQVVQSYQKTK